MIRETIVTTLNDDGSVHVAPMGVHEAGEELVIAPFRPSTTLENLRRSGQAIVNATDDVRVFAGCLTGHVRWPTQPASVVQGRYLEAALVHEEVEAVRVEDDPVRPRFFCRRLKIEQHGPFRGFNRAQAAIIEAAILLSRVDRLPAERIDREMKYLSIAVEKTAGEREQTAWRWILEELARRRAEPPRRIMPS
jgi:hypothetical protein